MMITTELKMKNGKVIKSQFCKMKCDKCKKEFDRKFSNVQKSRNNFNNLDLCAFCCRSEVLTIYNKKQKGKSPEERLGEEKGKQLREKRCKNVIGYKNPNYKNQCNGNKGLLKFSEQCKGKTYEEIYGEEKALELKEKISLKTKGENNPMYGKPSPQGSGNGWSGCYKGHYFRSILELSYLKHLLDNDIQFETGELKHHAIEYEIDNKKRIYYTDFYLIETKEYIEIKPFKLINIYSNKKKFEAARNKLQNKFKILTENDINKINIDELWDLYNNGSIIFDKRYEQKFIAYVKERLI